MTVHVHTHTHTHTHSLNIYRLRNILFCFENCYCEPSFRSTYIHTHTLSNSYMCKHTHLYTYLFCRFVEPPVLRMSEVVEDSTCKIPLIFVLSSGVVRAFSLHSYMYLPRKQYNDTQYAAVAHVPSTTHPFS